MDMPSSSEQQLLSSLSFPPSLPETNAQDLESNTQTFVEQEESEAVSLQDAFNMELQDVTWPSQDDVILLASSDSVPDAPTLEEYDNGASGSFYSPSTSAVLCRPVQ
ncbi:Zinc finger protein ZFMSA12A [Dissostichus eleginoides]|uniref:Zinc finger protein ZFMSA12A n=1 Tax=Dissostichus eleginoides TaxID=100907 RepID=A0AAD9B0I4_DISEL|nr:Zinc finger protein ZFMSA12A [Dissostichus eleginoides]